MDGSVSEVNKLQSELVSCKEELSQIVAQVLKLNQRKKEVEKRVKSLQEELKLHSERISIGGNSTFERDDFPWSSLSLSKLRSVFKIQDFRSYQKSAINATMSRVDCILIMPTGGGKSLCFQLPAILSTGITIVVSPLISLMEDQLSALKELSISTSIFNGQTSKEETKSIYNSMSRADSDLKLLYVTPEKLAKSKRLMSQIQKLYKLGGFARLVIDEVHCASNWGHDFRPDYKFLGIMKRQFPSVPILGLTATSTPKVTLDVQKMLGIEGCLVFKDSFFRPNLKYEVYDVTTEDRIEEMSKIIKVRFPKESGIIYCLTVKDVETVTNGLRKTGIKCSSYHAQLENGERSTTQKKWYRNEIQIIVATVAFGMGINKLDVRFVIHYSISKSIENFYQESGRAGRDGAPAYCLLFYSFQDVFRATSMMMTEKNGTSNVYNMLSYCVERRTCRKKLIAQHFGDSFSSSSCQKMCDNCEELPNFQISPVDVAPLLKDVLRILEHSENLEQRMTELKLINSLYSKGDKKLRVDGVGIPQNNKIVTEAMLAHLLLNGYIGEEFHFTPYATISYFVPGSKIANGEILATIIKKPRLFSLLKYKNTVKRVDENMGNLESDFSKDSSKINNGLLEKYIEEKRRTESKSKKDVSRSKTKIRERDREDLPKKKLKIEEKSKSHYQMHPSYEIIDID